MGAFALPIDPKLCRNSAFKLIALTGATRTWCNFLFIVITFVNVLLVLRWVYGQ